MEHHEISNLQAIKDCIKLVEKYPLDECLTGATKMCIAIEDDALMVFLEEARRDPCLDAIQSLAIAKWGARNVLAALLYLKGDTDGHQLQLASYKYAAKQATEDLKKLF